ncbi:stage III sporulation protein AA [Brevibacillus laterosporus]|uniref:Stage III sporulation protein AA n=2 Tax=Brevibacillus TaxID=55080 RepID=A0A0F7EI70_BRELA|nr:MULTISPECIES: stage III sporulation protein AA [Brevibacillus]AKF95290.1 stage III sporulation protein AA [Brevibacillus laterosporus]MCR8985237.1 stage III sporulation protein AA [Brevibacillus laterosporus]MCZ0830966.1 stage III sporulation protein AA [Brevibacillus halotolerans]OAJ75772.1 stage III sporulation protein AA [Brevibacillus sp. SKDU10]GIO00126.1 stage III sporulation protein AA [Brevibacillus halotolerans]
MKHILSLLPTEIRAVIAALPVKVQEHVEEIRLRQNLPIEIRYGHQASYVTPTGQLTANFRQGWMFREDSSVKLLNQISQHSLYALEEELRRGYITVVGGHRIGIAGRVVLEHGDVKGIRDITSFNIRIAREKKGVARDILAYLFDQGQFQSTLVISPPQCGKTTLLRDLARSISYGNEWSSSKKVGIVDERSEIAGCYNGIPQRDVGPRTDVLDACPKAIGMMMMIRSMSPDLIVVDEIGRQEDSEAIWEALHAGVGVLCSAHGISLEDIAKRPTISRLIKERVFKRYVILSRKHGAGTIDGLYDEHLRSIQKEKVICLR